MRILITGASGFLGPYLVDEFKKLGEIITVSRSGFHTDYKFDLTDPLQVNMMMTRFMPEIVVHAAALTDVDLCQREPALAMSQNCKATEYIASMAPPGCKIIYISTDMVYSGPGRHREDSHTENPINIYGMSKYLGEFAVARREKHLIIRTNIFGFSRTEGKSSLVDFLVGKFKSGERVNLFTDLMFSPISTKGLSRFLTIMAATNINGTYNIGSSTGMSKSKFALVLANELKIPAHYASPDESFLTRDRAIRPSDTRMDVTRFESRFGFNLPTLENEIRDVCREHQCVH